LRFLALDISTKTGFAIFDNEKLVQCGLIKLEKPSHYKADVKTFKDLPQDYPLGFMVSATELADECLKVYEENACELVVIEHTEKGRARLSQRLLEWINYEVANRFVEQRISIQYLFVSDWREATKCYLKHWPEYKMWNSKIGKLKKAAVPTKSGAKIAKIDGKIVTKVDQKKLSIIIANNAFGLELKDDNIADAVNLGHAAGVCLHHLF